MNSQELYRCEDQLNSRWAFIRRRAVRRLSEDESGTSIPTLVTAIASADPGVKSVAETKLRNLRSPQQIDQLCGLWAQTRNPLVGGIIRSDCSSRRRPATASKCKCQNDTEPLAESVFKAISARQARGPRRSPTPTPRSHSRPGPGSWPVTQIWEFHASGMPARRSPRVGRRLKMRSARFRRGLRGQGL